MNTVFLMLGSNLGDRLGYLRRAREKIIENIGILSGISSVYESEPWGFRHKNNFLNQCLIIDTALQAGEIISYIADHAGGEENRSSFLARSDVQQILKKTTLEDP